MKRLYYAPIVALVISIICTIMYPSITSGTAVGICLLLTVACLTRMRKSK